DELGRLQPSPPEMAALVKRPETEAHMGREGKVKDRRARRRLPNQLLDRKAALHRCDRNVAERVIGEMQRHIGIEDKTGREPDLTKAWHGGSLAYRGRTGFVEAQEARERVGPNQCRSRQAAESRTAEQAAPRRLARLVKAALN